MVGSQKGGTLARKSTRLEKKRRKVIIHDLLGTNLGSKIHSASRSEENLVVVTQEEESIASPSQVLDLDERTEKSPILDFVEEALFNSLNDDMPTHLKYSRFQGDGSQDVDDWLSEFESIALANQEDLEAKSRIFQDLLKGEALKWYSDIPDRNRNDWDDFISLFLRAFREARGEARALGCLSQMTMKTSKSVWKYG